MKLIIGLGNPGDKYEKTRHNIGFILLSLLANQNSVKFKMRKSLLSKVTEIKLAQEKIILCKPQTFMNNSNQAVSKIINYYKIKTEDILIIQDEIDLLFGKIKLSTNSSSAGHKGVQSIIDYLDTQKFKRLRFGVKHENNKIPIEIFVLKNFSKEELAYIEKEKENLINTILDNI